MVDAHFRIDDKVKRYLREKYKKNFSEFLREAIKEKLSREEPKKVINELYT